MPKFRLGPEGEGLAVIKDKYIWNGPVYGESTFVREMHQISTIGAENKRFCRANDTNDESPFFQILMGVYDMTIYDTPNVATMLHFDQSKWNINDTCHRAVDVVDI